MKRDGYDERNFAPRSLSHQTAGLPMYTDPTLRFADEDGFLHGCDIHADELEKRVRSAHSNVRVFRLGREELQLIADNYARCVCIARAYHLAEANRRAMEKQGDAA